MTEYRLVKDVAVPSQRIGGVEASKRAITPDTDLARIPRCALTAA
jgi:hypothetical protein